MADTRLYPTPTRLALLGDVDQGNVYKHTSTGVTTTNGGFQVVTARIEEAAQAGWVELGDKLGPLQRWRLTDRGRAVLDRAAETR